jgi:hypothetical protein
MIGATKPLVGRALTALVAASAASLAGPPATAAPSSTPDVRAAATFGTAVLRAPAKAAVTAAPRLAEGSFVEFERMAFKIVGGAPVRVTSWAAVGGQRPTRKLTLDQWNALVPRLVRDGTFVTASDGRTYRFVAGAPFYVSTWAAFGGPKPTSRIDVAAITHAGQGEPWQAVNAATLDQDPASLYDDGDAVNVKVSLNGRVFVRGAQTGRIYKMVAGAPLYVSDWALFGGPKPVVTVDQAAIDRAGQPGHWRFVRRYPEGPWYIRGVQTGQVYTIAGGAPVYLATPAQLTMPLFDDSAERTLTVTPADVDQGVIDRATGPAPYDHLRMVPADGTLLEAFTGAATGANDSRSYTVKAGVPTEVDPYREDFPEPTGYGLVDQLAIDHAGQPGLWSHLRAPT